MKKYHKPQSVHDYIDWSKPVTHYVVMVLLVAYPALLYILAPTFFEEFYSLGFIFILFAICKVFNFFSLEHYRANNDRRTLNYAVLFALDTFFIIYACDQFDMEVGNLPLVLVILYCIVNFVVIIANNNNKTHHSYPQNRVVRKRQQPQQQRPQQRINSSPLEKRIDIFQVGYKKDDDDFFNNLFK